MDTVNPELLFNLKTIYDLRTLRTYHLISVIISLCCFFKFYFIIANYFQTTFNYGLNNDSYQLVYFKSLENSMVYFEDIIAIASSLYTDTSEIFLVIGYVLLIAMVGAIIMALSTVKQTRIIDTKSALS